MKAFKSGRSRGKREGRKISENNILFLQSNGPTPCHPSANKCRKVQIDRNAKRMANGRGGKGFSQDKRVVSAFTENLPSVSG